MAIAVSLGYGILFANQADYVAAVAANAGSIVLNMTPDVALATFPAGTVAQVGLPYFSAVPNGIVTLGTYSAIAGTPGIVFAPNTISTATLTTAVTETVYGSFLNVLGTYALSYTWVGVLYAFAGTTTPFPTLGTYTGKWQQQVVTYTGDGASNRQVNTTFSLATGKVAVWIFDSSNVRPVFRHNQMTPTAAEAPASTGGIMSFNSTGFTVTDDGGSLISVNTNAHTYTAIILSDTTSDNRFMRCGQYTATGVGLTVTVTGAAPFAVTEVWVARRTESFSADIMPAGDGVAWAAEANTFNDQITALGALQFSIGTNVNVNSAGLTPYYYVAFAIPVGHAIRNMFQTFTGIGNGVSVNVALAFTPAFALLRDLTAGGGQGFWRGPLQAGTVSNAYGGAAAASGGIDGLANPLVIGANYTIAFYGFAMSSSGSVVQPPIVFPPASAPAPFVPGTPINYAPKGGYSIQWLLDQFELKYRDEEHL